MGTDRQDHDRKEIHRDRDRDLDSNRSTWTETEGWKMEIDRGTERGI